MKVIILIIVFLAKFFTNLNAQSGYQLTLNFENSDLFKNLKVDLYLYNGSPNFTKLVEKKEIQSQVLFSNAEKLYPGIFKLNIDGSKDFINLSLENGSDFRIVFPDQNILHAKIENSALNTLFLKAQMTNRPATIDSILTLFPTSAAAKYYAVNKQKQLIQQKGKNVETRNQILATTNFKDPSMIFLPNTFSLLNNYSNILPVSNDNYIGSMEKLMATIPTNSITYPFYLSWIFKNIRSYKSGALDSSFLFFYFKHIKEKDVNFSNPNEYGTIVNLALLMMKFPKGTIIPDLDLADSLHQEYSFKNIYPKQKYTLFVFFDPDCPHCKQFITGVNELITKNNAGAKANLKCVTILNADEENNNWQKFITTNNLTNWLHLKVKNPDGDYKSRFNAYTNPLSFLVNEKGEIVEKELSTETLEQYLK